MKLRPPIVGVDTQIYTPLAGGKTPVLSYDVAELKSGFVPAPKQLLLNGIYRPSPPTGMSLARVLDVLYSSAGAKIMKQLEADLKASGVRLDTGPGQYVDHDYRPKNPFLSAVTEQLYLLGVQESRVRAALPQAVIQALAEASDENGKISRADVKSLFGMQGTKLLQATEKAFIPQWYGGRPQLDSIYLSEDTLCRVARSRSPVPAMKDMPALGVVSAHFGTTSLAGVHLLAQQHLFPTSRAVFDAMREKGLEGGSLLGKPYSTDPTTYGLLAADGFAMCDASLDYNRGPFFAGPEKLNLVRLDEVSAWVAPDKLALIEDDKTLNAVTMLASAFAEAPPGERLLLMDDGGVLIRAMHTFFPHLLDRCVAVEQTERGAAELEGIELKMPVVNVARSWAKRLYESAMIGESVADSIDRSIADMGLSVGPPKEAAVIGYGAVGKATADALRRRGYTVWVHDTDPAAQARALADGCSTGDRSAVMGHGALLVSATGKTSLTPADFVLLPDHAIVANAASEKDELGMHTVGADTDRLSDDPEERISDRGIRRSTFANKDVPLGDFAAFDDKFHRVMRGEGGRETLVLRSGFVVNMGVDIPPEFIQLTRGLMLAGALQAVSAKGAGLVDLDEVLQAKIVDAVRAHLAQRGLDLDKPDFRGMR